MTVFVDGPDGVGKTGYSHYVSELLGIPRLEMRPVADTTCIESKSEVFNAAIRDLHAQGVDVVVDRGSVSSIVYSRIFDRGEPDHAWETLTKVAPKIIYLRCDPQELGARYEDELWEPDEIMDIASEYDAVMDMVSKRTEANVKTVDVTSGAPDQIDRFLSDDSGVT